MCRPKCITCAACVWHQHALCAQKVVVELVHEERDILVHCWFVCHSFWSGFFFFFFLINKEALILKVMELGSNFSVFCSFPCLTSVIGGRTSVVHHELKNAAVIGFHACQGQEFYWVQQLYGMGSKFSVTQNWVLNILNSFLNTWKYLKGFFPSRNWT